ncbi:DUF4235 domain-containing protein [Nonomuraea candida]|uniref:DUF4235 domain-containing protein n=1 Tax=Nonomuraea candida TaxID=359159 RepID=UPI0005B9459C|nr:DUF4235 domain-containing protein [Nonomuraea candida]
MKPVEKATSVGMGLVSGALAASLFRQVWKLASGRDDAPEADDPDRTWTEVLVAAAVQGAIFGLVRAAVHRAGARTFQRRR